MELGDAMRNFATLGYENSPFVLTAKILDRNPPKCAAGLRLLSPPDGAAAVPPQTAPLGPTASCTPALSVVTASSLHVVPVHCHRP